MRRTDSGGVLGTAIAAAVRDGVGVLADGTFVHANAHLATLHGFEAADVLVGEPWETVVAPTDHDRIRGEVIPRVREGTPWDGDVVGRRADGSEIPLALTLRASNGGPLVWVAHPAASSEPPIEGTDRHRDRVPGRFDDLPVPIGVVSPTGDLLDCNEAAVSILGGPDRAALTGRSMRTFVVPADRDRVSGQLQHVIETGEPLPPFGSRLVGSDGEERTVEITATPASVGGDTAVRVVLDDVTDRRAVAAELDRYETITETVEDGIYVLDEDLRFTFVNDRLCELLGRAREELLGMHGGEVFAYDDELETTAATREQLVERGGRTGSIVGSFPTPSGERRLEARYRFYPDPAGEYRGSVGVVRDVTDRERHEQAIERQRDELATVNRINELVLELIHELIETANREIVERVVCERLAESALYQFAWTGERRLGSGEIHPRTTAGDGALESAVPSHTAGDPGPELRAIRTGAVQTAATSAFVAHGPDGDPQDPASILAVPLTHQETVYGVLVVHSARPEAFDEFEERGFTILGDTVGFAINEIQRRRLRYTDAVTELGFDLSEPDSVLARVASRYDCRLTVQGTVSRDGRWIHYVDVEDAPVDQVVRTLADQPHVETARPIDSTDAPDRLELVETEGSLIHRTLPTGVVVDALEFDADTANVVVHAPADVETRAVVKRVHSTFETAELVTRRDRDRLPEPPSFPREPTDDLTDRQREALEAAFRAGYFAWPRQSTGEDVADALGITAPTFHAHLRKAEESLLSALLDR